MNSSKKYLDKILSNQKEKNDVHIVIKDNTFDLIKLQNQKLFSFNCIKSLHLSFMILSLGDDSTSVAYSDLPNLPPAFKIGPIK